MPTLRLNRTIDYTIAPFSSTSTVPHLNSASNTACTGPASLIRTPLINGVSHASPTPTVGATWGPNVEPLHCYPVVRVPTSVYLLPHNPYVLRHSLDKTRDTIHKSDNDLFINPSTTDSRDLNDCLTSQSFSYYPGDLNAETYPFRTVVYSTPEPSLPLWSRHITTTHSGVVTSAPGAPLVHTPLDSQTTSSRGSVQLVSLCPTSHSTTVSTLSPYIFCPCSPSKFYSHKEDTRNVDVCNPGLGTHNPTGYSLYRSNSIACPMALQNESNPTYFESEDVNGFSMAYHPSHAFQNAQGEGVCEVDKELGQGLFTETPFSSPSKQEISSFLKASVSDIPLSDLEELLARSSVDDVYMGPVRDSNGKLMPLDPSVRTVNECMSLPYSSSSLAFSPPGIIMVTEMWPMFINERLSLCNHRIHTMNVETLRNCLYDHGLNQLGSPAVLRRRLQEFVRRAREAQMSASARLDEDSFLSDRPTSPSLLDDRDVWPVLKHSPPISPSGKATDFNVASCLADDQTNRTMKLNKPVILTPDTFYSYLLIIDLEATCDLQEHRQARPEYPHEIIEFPVLLYNTRSRRCVGVFHAYCKPRVHPDLTSFCTNLTQISQDLVDSAHPFRRVLAYIENWLFQKHRLSDVRCAIVCDCSSDMSKFMRIQCRLDQIALPSWATVWINLSKAFRIFYKLPSRHRVTLSTMLHDLNLSFIGQQHRGLDDAINILRVVRTLLADGCLLRVNERVDFGRPPHYVTSVPRMVAETTSGLMGSRLLLLSRKSKASTGVFSTNDKEDKRSVLPLDLPEDHRESLLWLANVQRTRVPRDLL